MTLFELIGVPNTDFSILKKSFNDFFFFFNMLKINFFFTGEEKGKEEKIEKTKGVISDIRGFNELMIKYDIWENCSIELQSLFFKVLTSLVSENKAISYNILVFEQNQVLKNLFYIISKNNFPVELLSSFISLLKAFLLEKKDQSTIQFISEIFLFCCASHQNENEQTYSQQVDHWYQSHFPFPPPSNLFSRNKKSPSHSSSNFHSSAFSNNPNNNQEFKNEKTPKTFDNNNENEKFYQRNSFINILNNFSSFEKDSSLKSKFKQGASFSFLKNVEGTPKNIIFRNLMLEFIYSFLINEKENETICNLFYNILTTDFIFQFINPQTHWTSVVNTMKILAILLEKPFFSSKFRNTEGWQHLYSFLPYFHDHREIYYILLSIMLGKPRVTQIPHFSLLSPDFSNIYSIFDISVSLFFLFLLYTFYFCFIYLYFFYFTFFF
jgi:hypothetical protein